MTLPYMPQAVVFDMDGLLFDTETLYHRAFIAAGTAIGSEMTTAIFRQTVGRPWPAVRSLLLDLYGPSFAIEAFKTAVQLEFDELAAASRYLKPGVIELLDALDSLSIPWAIATSSSRQSALRHLTTHDLLDRFPKIIAQGDYAAGKPAPDPFLAAARRLGEEPRHCLALEDSHNGIRSAAAAGMMTVMVPDLLEPTDEISDLCVQVLPDLHAVRALVLTAMRPMMTLSPAAQ